MTLQETEQEQERRRQPMAPRELAAIGLPALAQTVDAIDNMNNLSSHTLWF